MNQWGDNLAILVRKTSAFKKSRHSVEPQIEVPKSLWFSFEESVLITKAQSFLRSLCINVCEREIGSGAASSCVGNSFSSPDWYSRCSVQTWTFIARQNSFKL